MGTRPAAGKARKAAQESQVADREHGVDAVAVLGQAHGPDEDGLRPGAEEAGEAFHLRPRRAARALQRLPGGLPQGRFELGEVLGGTFDEAARDAPGEVEQSLHRAIQEGEIPTSVDGEPVPRQVRAEDRARGNRGHPVALETRLAIRVDDRDLGAPLHGMVEVLDGHRLVVRHVRAEEHDQVGVEPVPVGVRCRAVTVGSVEGDRRCGVAEAGGGVDVGRAEEPGGLLRHVVGLVGNAARGQEEGRARGIAFADGGEPRGRDLDRLGPGDAPETGLAGAPDHRVRQPPQGSQFR